MPSEDVMDMSCARERKKSSTESLAENPKPAP